MDRDDEFTISVVIPTYNKAHQVDQAATKLTRLLARMRNQHPVEVIFVNDGSSDKTAYLLKTAFEHDDQVRIVSHDRKRGLGQALRTGFSHANGDIIITTDLDEAYNLNTIPQILAHLLVYDVDVVTASPFHPKGGIDGVPRYCRFLAPGVCLLYRLFVRRGIHTWTAQFRAYRRDVVTNINFESNTELANTEIIVNAIRAGYSVSEYPIKQKFGQSGIGGLGTAKAHLRYQLRLLFSTRRQETKPGSLARNQM